MGTQYKSLLGLTEVIADSADISNIDLSATNITGLTTTNVTEGVNLYFTNARVNINPNVFSNTIHRDRTDNPHAVTATQVGIDDTDDISEGVTNLYYTDIRFDDRLATKTTTSLAEGSNLYYTDGRFDTRLATKTTTNLAEGTNLYYTDVRFDNRFGIKTTTDLTEGTNLYYTDARFDTRLATKTTDNLTEGTNLYYTTARANADFDTRLATKTTTNLAEGTNLYYTDVRFDTRLLSKTTTDLAEGTNLYYTDARFDTRLATKTTTDLTEGTNLYYTDARFDTRLATKTTDNLTEGTNLYYTETRVSANTDVKANSDYRSVGHLPLAGGTLTGNLNMGNQDIINSNALTIGASARKISITGGIEITGVGNTVDGANITCFTTTDNYPIFQNLNYAHNTAYLTFDGYYDYVLWKKSHSTATFQISKEYDQLNFNVWNTGAAGSSIQGIQSSHAMTIDANKLVKIYNNLDVTGNITVSGTVDGVDVATLNTNTTNHIANTNNPHGVLATQIADFDTEVSANTDVKANTAYTAVGHLPLAGGTLTGDLIINGELNIGGAKITRGATNGLQLYGTSGNISGPHIQAFVSSDTYPVYQQLNWSHNALWMCFDAYYESSLWRSSSSSSNLVFYKSNNTLYFQYDSGISAGSTITWNTGLAMSLTNGFITLGNGLYVTVDATINGELNVGGSKIPRGATNGLQLRGTVNNLSGPHLQAFVSSDTYPTYQLLNWSHNNVNMTFDSYYDGSWRSSSTSSNLLITKASTSVNFQYDSGIALGSVISWNTGLSMNTTNGLVSCNNGLSVTGNITVSGTVDGVDVAALNTSANNHISNTNNPHGVLATQITDFDTEVSANTDVKANSDYRVVGHLPLSGGTLSGNLDMGNYDIDNVNQVFIDRNGVANNKIVLYDGGTSSTTDFYGLGIQSSTLVYNVNATASNHKFYYLGTNELFRIGHAGVFSYRNLDVTGNITVSGTVDGVDVAALETAVSANTAYRNTGHLPLAGGTLTGDLDMNTNDITNIGDLVFAETTTVNPPPLTSDSGNAEYIASSSGLYDENRPAWEAFDGSIADGQQWISLSGVYNTSGTYLGTETTTVDGSLVSGEWLQLATTVRYWIDSFILFGRDSPYLNQAPKDIVVAVSDDGTNFKSVFTTTGLTFTESTPQTFTGITPTGGKYFRLISTKSASSGLVAVSRFDMTFRTFITLNSTLIADVSANTAKVSADGSIATHSDVNITSPTDGHVLTYDTGEWKNLAPSAGTYVKVDGTSTMTGNLNMGSNRITSVATPTTAGDAIPLAAHNTYVPTIGDGTNNFTLTSATGHYTVIGNMCHVSFYVLWTSKGSASGTIRLSLPFTSATGPYSSMALSAHNGIDASLPSIGCFNLSATNYVVFFDKPVGLFAMNQTSFTNAGAICGSGFFYL